MLITGYGKLARKRREALALLLIRGLALFVVVVLGALLAFIFVNAFEAINWSFLTEFPKDGMTSGGILPAIVGTLYLALGSMLISLPLGFGAAIYLAEYAKPGPLLTSIRLGITNLAGVPSVVFGLFGLSLFVTTFGFGRSLLSGCLTLGLLTLPTVTAAAEEALRQTPGSFREAALALGANRWQAVRQVVLPAALPGMLTGAILALGRAAGETAPITLTAATAFSPALPDSVFNEVMALTTHIFNLSTNGSHIAETKPQQFGSCLVLLALVLGMSMVAILIRAKLRKGRKWRKNHHQRQRNLVLLWRFPGLEGHQFRHHGQRGDRLHRSLRLRQIDFFKALEPDERFCPRGKVGRRDNHRGRFHLRPWGGSCRYPKTGRHGFSEAEPFSQVDLRQYLLWTKAGGRKKDFGTR
jgi:phosphate transport system permease protein